MLLALPAACAETRPIGALVSRWVLQSHPQARLVILLEVLKTRTRPGPVVSGASLQEDGSGEEHERHERTRGELFHE